MSVFDDMTYSQMACLGFAAYALANAAYCFVRMMHLLVMRIKRGRW